MRGESFPASVFKGPIACAIPAPSGFVLKTARDWSGPKGFMDYDLGYFDLETRVLEPLKNPSAQNCYLCLRYVESPMSPGRTAAEWRRVRDSNPRYPSGYAGFQDRCHQPLGQLSAPIVLLQSGIFSGCSAVF